MFVRLPPLLANPVENPNNLISAEVSKSHLFYSVIVYPVNQFPWNVSLTTGYY